MYSIINYYTELWPWPLHSGMFFYARTSIPLYPGLISCSQHHVRVFFIIIMGGIGIKIIIIVILMSIIKYAKCIIIMNIITLNNKHTQLWINAPQLLAIGSFFSKYQSNIQQVLTLLFHM